MRGIAAVFMVILPFAVMSSAAAENPSGQQEFLEQVRSARREAKGKILLGKREAMVAWKLARLFIYTHAERGSVTDRGGRISGRIAPFTWTARQRLKKGRVEIEPLCQSSRLFHIDDAKRNSLLFWHYVKTGELRPRAVKTFLLTTIRRDVFFPLIPSFSQELRSLFRRFDG